MSGDKTQPLDRLVQLLDGLTDAQHCDECKAYGHEPDSDVEDRDSEIDDNPSDFLEHCSCGLKDLFEAWQIAKSLAALRSPRPSLDPILFRVSIGDHHAEIRVDPRAPEAYHQGMVTTAIAEVLRRAAPPLVSPHPDLGEVSDGYHTFNELYEHRHALFAVACAFLGGWKSKLHDDGTMFPGWFIAGLTTIDGPATYHLPIRLWDRFPGREFPSAPPWDGHTPSDVVTRLWAHVASMKMGDGRGGMGKDGGEG